MDATAVVLNVRPIAGLIGAEVHGLDLAQPIDAATADAIRTTVAQYGVLVFPNQHIGSEQHRALARAMGTIKLPPDYFQTLADQGYPEIGVVSTENGLAYTSDQWHADVTWEKCPPKYSILHMQVLPPAGGDTMWSSQHVAYDRLSRAMQEFLEPLTAEHPHKRKADAGATHPVVIRHPVTGRKALFVNEVFTTKINGLEEDESEAVLQMLYRRVATPEYTCRWRWSLGDVAMWDNHFVLHYALGDYHPAPRKIHRIEIEGDAPIPALSRG